VRPGSVTPFAVFNDRKEGPGGGGGGGAVTSVLHRAVVESGASYVNAHPMHNEATIGVAPADLLRFLSLTGHEPVLFGEADAVCDHLGGRPNASCDPTAHAQPPLAPPQVGATAVVATAEQQTLMSAEGLAEAVVDRYLAVLSGVMAGQQGAPGQLPCADAAALREQLLAQAKSDLRAVQNEAAAQARRMHA
jgi:hypothetical protein